jgi:hypothetical protein
MPPTATDFSRTLGAALRHVGFYWLAAAFMVNALVFLGSTVHPLAMLTYKGMSAAEAAAFGALMGPMQVLGASWSCSLVSVRRRRRQPLLRWRCCPSRCSSSWDRVFRPSRWRCSYCSSAVATV